MVVMAPSDENECRQMLYTGFMHDGPAAVRYPRGPGSGVPVESDMQALPLGKAELRRKGSRIALLVFGSLLQPALEAGDAFNTTVVNMRFVKPLDEELINELARTHELLITLEENAVTGGAGSAVNECLAAANLAVRVVNLGLPDEFLGQGSREELLAECGLDAAGIRRTILRHTAQTGARARRRLNLTVSLSYYIIRARPKQPSHSHESAGQSRTDRHRRCPEQPGHAPAADRQGRHQGHPSSGARKRPLPGRAAHHRPLQHVRGVATQLQGHAHVALRRNPERAQHGNFGGVVQGHAHRNGRTPRGQGRPHRDELPLLHQQGRAGLRA